MNRILVTVPVALSILAACCTPDTGPKPRKPRRRILYLLPFRPDTGLPPGVRADAVARVEVADAPPSRARGLMERESLKPDSGMLFVYPEEGVLTFWMKNTRIPLSIAFADAAGRIVRILDMEPPRQGVKDDDLPRYESGRPALYALEMERGWFSGKGIRVGDRLDLHPELEAIEGR